MLPWKDTGCAVGSGGEDEDGGCPLCDGAAQIQGATQGGGPQAALACASEDVQRLWNISRDGDPRAPGEACAAAHHQHITLCPSPR